MKVKVKLSNIDLFGLSSDRLEQVINLICGKKGMPQYAHDLHDGTTNLMVMFDDANETVCDDGNMDLNADSILILAPKGLDLEVLLDPKPLTENQNDKELKLFD